MSLLTKLGWWLAGLAQPKSANLYRVVRVRGGFEPQMSYQSGLLDHFFWTPLNAQGYWVDPNSFMTGEVTKHPEPMQRPVARKAVELARRINTSASGKPLSAI